MPNYTIESLSESIANAPGSSALYLERGKLHADKASSAFLTRHPANGKRSATAAAADFTACIYFDPNCAEAFYLRGRIYRCLERERDAVNDFARAISLQPDYGEPYIVLAWIHATSEDEGMHDARAIEEAETALHLCGPELRLCCLEVLAAACADNCQFERAIELQSQVVQLTTWTTEREIQEERLDLYRTRMPFRDIEIEV